MIHAWIDTLLELAILVIVYLSYRKECRAVEMAEIEFEYDKAWNEKMFAREKRRTASKHEKYDPCDQKDMD